MAQTSVRVNAKNFAMVSDNTPNTHVAVTVPGPNALDTNYAGGGNWMLFQFDDPTESLGTYRLYDVRGVFNVGRSATTSWIKAVLGDYDPNTVAWNTKPEISGIYGSLVGGGVFPSGRQDVTFSSNGTASAKTALAKELLKYCGGIFEPTGKSYLFELYTELQDSSAPYLEFIYDDTETVPGKIVYKSGPTSGYANPREPIAFAWGFEKTGDYYCAADFTQTSAVFYWKESGAENYTAVNIQGEQKGVTIPANTFPTGTTIEWYVQGTEAGGATSQTEVYSFSTSAGTVTATPIEPVSSIESNNEEIVFKWSYSSPDGFPASRYALKWREMGATEWNTIVDSQDVTNSYTVPANTFPAGEIQWGVLPYNIDGTAGSGSVASFISFGAPEAPPVTTDAVPFLTVGWQSDDQQAYEISIGENVYGPYFGTEKSFKLAEPLADGTYTVKVRVMGEYGLWSPEGSTSVNITNVPGETITLGSMEALDNCIMWTTEEETADFLIYRDGKWIGHTESGSFRDRYVTGTHVYQVLNRLPDGNYSASGELTLTAETDCVYIALLSGSDWLKLEIPRKGQKDPEFTKSAESFYGHLAGDVYPSAIVSGYREDSMSFGATFLQEHEADRQRFEAMLGKSVIMKLRDGSVIFGILDNLKKEHKKLSWTAYSFTLRRIEWEDFVDDTQ